jgi:hypothetical protein
MCQAGLSLHVALYQRRELPSRQCVSIHGIALYWHGDTGAPALRVMSLSLRRLLLR